MYIQKQFASRVWYYVSIFYVVISTSCLISMHEIAAFLSRDFSKEEEFVVSFCSGCPILHRWEQDWIWQLMEYRQSSPLRPRGS